jgi:hypothetical protein
MMNCRLVGKAGAVESRISASPTLDERQDGWWSDDETVLLRLTQ